MKKIFSFVPVLAISFAVFTVLHTNSVLAAVDTCTWTGGGSDANVSTAANWTGCADASMATIPESGDALLFPDGVTNKTVVNDLAANSTFTAITFDGPGYTLSGQPIKLSGYMSQAGISGTNTISVNIEFIDGTPHISANSGIMQFTSNFNISSSTPLVIEVQPSATMNIVGDVSGTGALSKIGTGVATMSGDNSYNGQTIVDEGVLRTLTSTGLGSTTGNTKVNSGGALKIVPASGVTSFSEPLILAGPGTGTVNTLEILNTSPLTYTGGIALNTSTVNIGSKAPLTIDSVVSGSGGFTYVDLSSDKSAGLTFTKQNTFSGTTTINAPMMIDGKVADVTVVDGGVLKGKGTVGDLTVQSGGKVSPGNSPGCLNSGNTTMVAGAILDIEIGGKTVCTEYDQLKVAGQIDLGNATLNTSFVNSFRPAAGDEFVIVEASGTLSGTFANLADGATLTVDGVAFKVSYAGNKVTLTVIGGNNVEGAPTTPNTGMKLLMANPILTLLSTVGSAAALLGLSRKYSNLFVK